MGVISGSTTLVIPELQAGCQQVSQIAFPLSDFSLSRILSTGAFGGTLKARDDQRVPRRFAVAMRLYQAELIQRTVRLFVGLFLQGRQI